MQYLRFRFPRAALTMALFLAAAVIGACADYVVGPRDERAGDPIRALRLSATEAELADGATLQLLATPLNARGEAISLPAGSSILWQSSDTSVATVDENGLVLARRPGIARISAVLMPEGRLIITATITVIGVPVAIERVSGDAQTADRGKRLPQPIVVIVRDRHGNPMGGVEVRFTTADGGILETPFDTTDATGTASSVWRLGSRVGTQTASATVAGVGSVTFTATATRPAAAALLVVSGNAQTGTVGSALAAPIVVRVLDAEGNGLEEQTVSFTPATGSGSANPAQSLSNVSGEASTTWTLGTAPGAQSLVVSVVGLPSVTITATAVVGQAATVVVTPATANVIQGRTIQLSAAAQDQFGNAITTRPFTWSSLDPSIATVNSSGVVTAVNVGVARIVASMDGAADTATITVETRVKRVDVQPDTLRFRSLGASARVVAQAYDHDDNAIVETISWMSTVPAIASVDGTGLVTAHANGVARIIASVAGRADTSVVIVRQAPFRVVVTPGSDTIMVGESQAFAAVVTDANGNVISDATITWSSTNPVVATIDASGVATGVSAGTAGIVATGTVAGEGSVSSDPASLLVRRRPPTALQMVQGDGQAGEVGTTLPVSLVVRVVDAAGLPVPGILVRWTPSLNGGSADPAEGISDEQGLVSTRWTLGTAPGAHVMTASSDGLGSVTFRATAVAGPVVIVEISPADASVVQGETVRFTASARDRFGNEVARPRVWSSTDSTVAIPDADGVVRTIRAGTANIIVSVDGVADTAVIVVRPRLTRVEVSPDTARLNAIGDTVRFQARAYDATGEPMDVSFAWGSTNPDVATVDAQGLVTARGNGTAGIYATSGAFADTATVIVRQRPANISISPTADTISVGDTTRFVAVVYDANGNVIQGAAVDWVSTNPAVAVVDGNGLATGISAGETTIAAWARMEDGTDGPYAQASLLVRSTGLIDPYEPNDTTTTAWDIDAPRDPRLDAYDSAPGLPFSSVDDARGSAMIGGADVDWFRFTMPSNGTLTVTVNDNGARPFGSSGGNLYAVLVNERTGERHVPMYVPYNGTATFRYSLEASSIAGAYLLRFQHTHGATGKYQFQLTTAALRDDIHDYLNGDFTRTLEPNDLSSLSGANAPREMPYDINGRTGASGQQTEDTDFFAIPVMPGSDVTIFARNLDASSELYLAMVERLADGSFRTIAETTLPPGERAALNGLLDGTGPYFARVTSDAGAAYELCVTSDRRCRARALAPSGAGQVGYVREFLRDSLAVTVYGRAECVYGEGCNYYDPQPNVLVQFIAGDGTLSATEVLTDAAGRAAVQYRLPDVPGADTVIARVVAAGRDSVLFPLIATERINNKRFVKTAAGGNFSCGVTDAGEGFCWGGNRYGQLGAGVPNEVVNRPIRVAGGHRWSTIEANNASTACGITVEGRLYCWGEALYGSLGDGRQTNSFTPVEVAGGGTWLDVSVSNLHTCAIRSDRDAYCWGYNAYGQLGNGSTTNSTTPVRISAEGNWYDIAAGDYYFTCGVTGGGYLYCWGANDRGQLGKSSATSTCESFGETVPCSKRPDYISSVDASFLKVAAGGVHACAATFFNTLCWGMNYFGQVGDGTNIDRFRPVGAGPAYAQMSLGSNYSCAVTTDNRPYCWGSNENGELGIGQGDDRNVATQVDGNSFSYIAAGDGHTCAVSTESKIYCWGKNYDYQQVAPTNEDRVYRPRLVEDAP